MTSDRQDPSQPTVRVMHLRRPYFDLVASGAKTVEVRVAYPNRRNLAPGQFIRFESEGAQLLTRITRVSRYGSFDEILDHEDAAAISGQSQSREELMAAIRSIYDEAKEALGVLAAARSISRRSDANRSCRARLACTRARAHVHTSRLLRLAGRCARQGAVRPRGGRSAARRSLRVRGGLNGRQGVPAASPGGHAPRSSPTHLPPGPGSLPRPRTRLSGPFGGGWVGGGWEVIRVGDLRSPPTRITNRNHNRPGGPVGGAHAREESAGAGRAGAG